MEYNIEYVIRLVEEAKDIVTSGIITALSNIDQSDPDSYDFIEKLCKNYIEFSNKKDDDIVILKAALEICEKHRVSYDQLTIDK